MGNQRINSMAEHLSLHGRDPKTPLRSIIERTVRTATDLDVATAFMTQAGVDFYATCSSRIDPQCCRLSVSVHFPTNLDALQSLGRRLRNRLHIYLGGKTPYEKISKFSPLLHSKVIWIGHGHESVSIFVGSHNWTATALDGVNMEASAGIECESQHPFAQDIKAHLDSCFDAGVEFNPADLDFYKSIQVDLYRSKPLAPEGIGLQEFEGVPAPPALVIHCEDHREHRLDEQMFLYLPLGSGLPHKWFNPTAPTRLFLYLYPRGSLFGRRPPSEDPFLYEGDVTTFAQSDNPITGQMVNSQMRNLNRPILEEVPERNIPQPEPGVEAQVVAALQPKGRTQLAIYSQDGHRPGVRVKPKYFEEPMAHDTSELWWLAEAIHRYYGGESIRDGRFVYRRPRPAWVTSIDVPGKQFYRIEPDSILQHALSLKHPEIEVDVESTKTEHRYFYQVWFVFHPLG
jgi:hypothetical protein